MLKQSDVDDATMRIEDPTRIVGSGFIQFPPQKPFQQNVVVQPPTIAHFHQDEHGYRQPQVPTPKPAKKAEPTGEVRTLRSSKQPDVPIYQNQRAAQAETVAQAHELKLSKAQAKRRRKKLRDGLGAI
jgi:hypothetical protein